MGLIHEAAEQRVTPESARAFVQDVLVAYDLPQDQATLVADALVLADLRGVDSHGINRLPGYVSRIRRGLLATDARPVFEMRSPVVALLDAQNTLGFVAASMAIDKGIEMAQVYGLAMVAVKHSNHYGMASTYLLRAIQSGYAAMAFTNASPAMPAWGGMRKLLGTSPFAVGLPGGKRGDFVLDMSPSVAARGKLRKAARRGQPIPEGFALDELGRPTTDAEKGLKGSVLPIGGPKGSGLAMMMDIFGGLMTGAAFKGDVVDMNSDKNSPQNVGHWFLVFQPEIFLADKKEYEDRMDELLEAIRQGERAEGCERIFTSGEIEAEKALLNSQMGIPYTAAEVESLHLLANEAGCKSRLTVDGYI